MRKRINILVLIIISIFLIPVVASADLGPKPSIHINIKNLETDNYIIDLLTYAEKDEDYYPDSNFSNNGRTINIDEPGELDKNGITVYFDEIAESRKITIDQAKQLYNIDYNGWISANTRKSTLWGECNGNSNHEHSYNYFGTPTRYKILIINNDTGEIKVSDEIVREDFNSYVTLDYKTMTYKTGEYYNKLLVDALTCIILTVLIELTIAFAFKTHHYVAVIITNIITNILLQFNLILFSKVYNYLLVLMISEVLVFIIEYLEYNRRFKEFDHLKTLIYTIVANAVTLILTFVLHTI